MPPPPWRRLLPLAGAALGGAAVAISLPPWGWWPAAITGVAAFDLALGSHPTRRRRATTGLLFGVSWMAIGLAWVWFLTPPGYIIVSFLFGALHMLAALAAPVGRWAVLGRPAAHTAAEVVRAMFPFGGVPLASLGISHASSPLLHLGRVGGVTLITWAVFQIGFAASAWYRQNAAGVHTSAATRSDRWRWAPAATIVVVLGAIAGSAAAPAGGDIGGTDGMVRIAAVQGGGEQGTSALQVPSRIVTERHLAATSEISPDDGIELVVWPENAIDVSNQPFADSPAATAIAAQAARLGAPFAVGVTVDSEFAEFPEPDRFVNAQYVITTDGELVDGYEKVHIVPFGEYVPLRGLLEAIGAPIDQIPKDAQRGRGPAVIEVPDTARLGVMISFEVFFGYRGRAAADGEILINPTNGASYTWTIVQTQQIAASRLRAVETGRWVVQVAPTGLSAFVSPTGEVFQRTNVSEARVITMDIPRRTGSTLFTRLGAAPWFGAVLAVVLTARWRARASGPRLR